MQGSANFSEFTQFKAKIDAKFCKLNGFFIFQIKYWWSSSQCNEFHTIQSNWWCKVLQISRNSRNPNQMLMPSSVNAMDFTRLRTKSCSKPNIVAKFCGFKPKCVICGITVSQSMEDVYVVVVINNQSLAGSVKMLIIIQKKTFLVNFRSALLLFSFKQQQPRGFDDFSLQNTSHHFNYTYHITKTDGRMPCTNHLQKIYKKKWEHTKITRARVIKIQTQNTKINKKVSLLDLNLDLVHHNDHDHNHELNHALRFLLALYHCPHSNSVMHVFGAVYLCNIWCESKAEIFGNKTQKIIHEIWEWDSDSRRSIK